MTKEDLFLWANLTSFQYPMLSELKEEKIINTNILKLTVPYGRYKGLILTFDKTLACTLRRHTRTSPCRDCNTTKEPYAVALVRSYIEAQKLLLECVAWNKKYKRENRNLK